jgi:hypothetical protein
MQYVRDLENIDVVSDAVARLAFILFDPGGYSVDVRAAVAHGRTIRHSP